ncbi:unnamed protein product [Peniophora sp. CBMAI 1063]|nr:unnamed protein product [Peniophora sp. CBMAI 1063]
MGSIFAQQAPFMPIVINFVVGVQSVTPDTSLTTLLVYLEHLARAERNEAKLHDVRCPRKALLYPCLDVVLKALANRVAQQPQAWRYLLPAAMRLFQLYQLPATEPRTTTPRKHETTFDTVEDFLSAMIPMDQMAEAVGRSNNPQHIADARQAIAEFATEVLQMISYHQAFSRTAATVWFQKTRRTAARHWLRIVYSLLDERFGLETYHPPLSVLCLAERSVPGFDGMIQQHSFALSLFFPGGLMQAPLPRSELDALVRDLPINQLFALRPVSDIWPDRSHSCAHCGQDLTALPKRRACKGCKRPAYCNERCQKGDWQNKHSGVCKLWASVDERMSQDNVKNCIADIAHWSRVEELLQSSPHLDGEKVQRVMEVIRDSRIVLCSRPERVAENSRKLFALLEELHV